MARYERDYGRDFGRWGWDRAPYGGMRSDGWGGTSDWRRFAGEEGWYGEGYEGMPGFGYDVDIRAGMPGQRWGGYRESPLRRFYGRRPRYESEYDFDYDLGGRPYGDRWESGSRGREYGFAEGWEDMPGRSVAWERRPAFSRWGGPMRALDIMTEDPFTLTENATIADAARIMRDINVGIVPVVDNEDDLRLKGVITDRDIAVRAIADGMDAKTRVDRCMSTDVRTVNRNDSVYDVMRVMRQEQVRRVPVTDREGRLVGIIAQADLAVDYAGTDYEREIEVEETIERISEPAEPQRRVAVGVGRKVEPAGDGGREQASRSRKKSKASE